MPTEPKQDDAPDDNATPNLAAPSETINSTDVKLVPKISPTQGEAAEETARVAAGGTTGAMDAAPAVAAKTGQIYEAEQELEAEIEAALEGKVRSEGVARERVLELCRVIDYWLAEDTEELFESCGLIPLAQETKRDYVTASFLAWRGEYKVAFITLRSFLESFCLLLYYLNQGCDRSLYLRGEGYKLMLHKMAQKHSDADQMHAFRRHYHLLIKDSSDNKKIADQFFDEINSCYGLLSKAVHGDYPGKAEGAEKAKFVVLLERVLIVCNTLALHEPILDATEDDLKEKLGEVLKPLAFEGRSK